VDFFQNILNLDIAKNLDLNSILNFPCTIFMKDKNSKYLGANEYLSNLLGFKDSEDLVGCSDRDLWPTDYELLLENDKKVMHQNLPNTFYESGTLPNNSIINAISHKVPLYSRENKVIGIMGISIIIHENDSIQTHREKENKIQLTTRQIDCLYYLALGMTAKLIANKLNISSRTVEHYIETIKTKLNCYNRSELIAKALELPMIKTRVLNQQLMLLKSDDYKI